jgi:hypothetical protein
MWIGDSGDVDTWINQRGWGTGIVSLVFRANSWKQS